MKSFTAFVTVVAFLGLGRVEAEIIRVPRDYPTIQAAMDVASEHDIVLVEPGTYTENILMKSGVTLKSEAGAANTTIDGAGAGSVIDCIGVSDRTTIRGFTIRNGTGTLAFNGRYGGGIRCWNNASPTIEDNVFIGNAATFGGAVGCRYGSAPMIRHNIFEANTAQLEGGGIYAIDAVGRTITIESNDLRLNVAKAGGAIWVGAIDVVIRQNVVAENRADRIGGLRAAGGVWAGFAGTKMISRNLIIGNVCPDLGGGMWVNDGTTTIENNTFFGNASPLGGGIATGGLGQKTIRANILAGSKQGAGIHCTASGPTQLACNDLWGNAGGDDLPECLSDGGDNLTADPLFCDVAAGDFSLQGGSPCLPGGAFPHCQLIGAVGPGRCHLLVVKPETWSGVKTMFR